MRILLYIYVHTPVYCDLRPRSLIPCEGGRAADDRALDMLFLASEKDLAEADTRCDSVMPIRLHLDIVDNAGTPGSILRGRMSDDSDSVLVLGEQWACSFARERHSSINLDDRPRALAPEMRFLESQPASGNSIVSYLDMPQILQSLCSHRSTTENVPHESF